MRNDKQWEDVFIEKAVKTTIRILYYKGLCDNYDDVEETIENYLLNDEVNKRRKPDLEELSDVIECFFFQK